MIGVRRIALPLVALTTLAMTLALSVGVSVAYAQTPQDDQYGGYPSGGDGGYVSGDGEAPEKLFDSYFGQYTNDGLYEIGAFFSTDEGKIIADRVGIPGHVTGPAQAYYETGSYDAALDRFGAELAATPFKYPCERLGGDLGGRACEQLGGPFSADVLYEESQWYDAPGGPADMQNAAAQHGDCWSDAEYRGLDPYYTCGYMGNPPGTISEDDIESTPTDAPTGSPHSCNFANPDNRCTPPEISGTGTPDDSRSSSSPQPTEEEEASGCDNWFVRIAKGKCH